MDYIKPKDQVTASSCFGLATAAFDLINSPSGSYRLNPNTTITTDTPVGVLSGMVAKISGNDEATYGNYNAVPIGLFAKNSEGNPWENSPALSSGIVAIYMNGGNFLLYVFETHDVASPYAAKTLSSAYAPGTLLYTSPYALVGPDVPSANGGGGGIDIAVAVVSKTPNATDKELGLKLLI